ncbi:MAG TPA: hypothetical protein VNJ31_04965 [Methyloceanibacter sp.]|nr:hypothetical protein [Methyloceanibacter sp.]
MVRPVREKRAWPPRDKDADGESIAAFEATVAVVKETVVRSGEVLVSAREDLSDHQRWLKAQAEAVEADRERHARWLERQRERQEALARRAAKRAARRAKRQAALQSAKSTLSAAARAMRAAIASAFGWVFGGLNALDAWVWRGIVAVAGRLKVPLGRIAGAAGAGLRAGAQAFSRATLACARACQSAARSLGRAAGAGLGRTGAMLQTFAPRLTQSLGRGLSQAQRAGRAVHVGLGDRMRPLRTKLAPVFGALGAKAYALAPNLFEDLRRLDAAAVTAAKTGLSRLSGAFAGSSPAQGENALSLPLGGRADRGQMLIVGGTVLLICGALMLGGGLMLRAGGLPQLSASSEPASDQPIAWLFDHETLPIDERAIFLYETTPEGVRIKGFAIGGVNMSDQPIERLEGVLKPDLHGEDLKLDLVVEAEAPGTPQTGVPPASPSEAAPTAVTEVQDASPAAPSASETATSEFIQEPPPPPVIRPDASFRLIFSFAAPEAPQDVLKAAGGLLLKVHYELGGKQQSFIQYLPPALLERQIAELQQQASNGS